jgi:hypothetical protein
MAGIFLYPRYSGHRGGILPTFQRLAAGSVEKIFRLALFIALDVKLADFFKEKTRGTSR